MGKTSPQWSHVRNIFFVFMLDWCWTAVIMAILRLVSGKSLLFAFGAPAGPVERLTGLMRPDLPAWAALALIIVSSVVVAPLVEEVMFRYLPLTLVRGTGKARELAVIIGICGVLFGYLHGSAFNVFIQGVGGALYGWLFLKNHSSAKAAYFSCVIVHALHNGTLILISLAL
jgi:membrane protease YdiL (CAAX protease family)